MPDKNNITSKVQQSVEDKASELATTDKAKGKIDGIGHQNRARQEASYWQQIKAMIEQSLPGRLFYQNEESKKIFKALCGELGDTKEERDRNQRQAQDKVQQALSELKRITSSPGDASWLNVCDNMFRALMAYMEYRKALGYPDTIGGRIQSMGVCLFQTTRASLPFAFVEGCWDICSKIVKEFQPDSSELSALETRQPLDDVESLEAAGPNL